MLGRLYTPFAFLGAMSFSAAFFMGFRHEAGAPAANILFNIALFAAFIVVHIAMTMPAFKKVVFGRPEGTLFERQIYVTISIVTWVGLYCFHEPIGLFGFTSPAWLQFIGYCAMVLSVVGFFEFANFEVIGGLLGKPGTDLSHSVGNETPIMREGSYASVRHPMYRAAFFITFSSLLVHPNAAQLFFAILTSAGFLGFIPFEEHQLVKARGDDYRDYMRETPYRAFRGIW
jgi:protein-S-isoprenylcysteine O-methyltransferase Ste14